MFRESGSVIRGPLPSLDPPFNLEQVSSGRQTMRWCGMDGKQVALAIPAFADIDTIRSTVSEDGGTILFRSGRIPLAVRL